MAIVVGCNWTVSADESLTFQQLKSNGSCNRITESNDSAKRCGGKVGHSSNIGFAVEVFASNQN